MTDFSRNLWTFKSKGSDSAFGGNEGYPDEPKSHYVYDSTVKNHDKVLVGDLVIIASKRKLLGVSKIVTINVEEEVAKVRFRCPECKNQEIYARKGITPRYKCRNKHEFEIPMIQEITVTRFTAYYAPFFIEVPKLDTRILKPYYINYNLYYSIQKTQLSFLYEKLSALSNRLLDIGFTDPVKVVLLPDTIYIPDQRDTRKRRNILQPTREGQNKFRNDLFDIYGTRCMLSGYAVGKAIEASHINPYKGAKDHHLENGLLLRRDLHALFDCNLLGIDPSTMTIHLHPSIKDSHYKEFIGKRIIYERTDFGPSYSALVIRWEIFQYEQLR